jgi:hypothetical protein
MEAGIAVKMAYASESVDIALGWSRSLWAMVTRC